MSIAERYQRVAAEVAEAAMAAGRAPEDVLLVAVSKTVGPEGVAEAIKGGARDFGENRPDQIVLKSAAFPEARWHFIGNIQSRRIPEIVASATLIHSLYQRRHAEKIDRAAAELSKVQDVLIEVNVSGEASKSGVA
ncbi:MAG: alanine racemase, partial [Adlercreutzia sp.]|nr:alanine racemase [Adlercreutzia sp.]